jgi:3-deoxy-D-manno-octulosonate 8-phosphate phosphatase (KDO 8-P phosphatase)
MNVFELFENNGGKFLVHPHEFNQKVQLISAYVFDWDGVFTNGGKDHEQQSTFNEADSMGTNLLRFCHYLKHNKLPLTALLSGENNKAAFHFSTRENFTLKYFKTADKLKALEHMCREQKITPTQIMYVFDDVLDLGIAAQCGLRIFIPRKANPLLNNYVINNNLADYMTANDGGNCAVRETCEMLLASNGLYEEVIKHRIEYSGTYKKYIDLKKATQTLYYTLDKGEIIEHHYQKL